MKVVKHNIPRYRGDFITSIDSLFDRMLKTEFSNYDRDLGSDFFLKGSYPKVNVYKDEEKLYIEAAIPGLTKNDISVSIKDGTLSISGKSGNKEGNSPGKYLIREIKKSSFTRSFLISDDLDQDTVRAKVNDGLLTLSISWRKPKEKEQEEIKFVEVQ